MVIDHIWKSCLPEVNKLYEKSVKETHTSLSVCFTNEIDRKLNRSPPKTKGTGAIEPLYRWSWVPLWLPVCEDNGIMWNILHCVTNKVSILDGRLGWHHLLTARNNPSTLRWKDPESQDFMTAGSRLVKISFPDLRLIGMKEWNVFSSAKTVQGDACTRPPVLFGKIRSGNIFETCHTWGSALLEVLPTFRLQSGPSSNC